MISRPNVPLWARAGRSGRSAAAASSSSSPLAPGPSRSGRPVRSALTPVIPLVGCRSGPFSAPQAHQPLGEAPLALAQSLLQSGRKDEGPAFGPDAEGDGDRVILLVTDGQGDASHAQLSRTPEGPARKRDGRVTRRQAHDLDLPPAHAPDPEAENLPHRPP